MSDADPPFQDPSLKEAIRALRGGHRASNRLRAKVNEQLAELREQESRRIEHRQNWRWIAAVAAVVLMAVGISLYYSEEDSDDSQYGYGSGSQNASQYSQTDALLADMLRVHQLGSTVFPDEKPLAANGPAATSAEASKVLGRSVPVTNFADNGWKLDTAALCTIYYSPAVRFHFVRNGQAMTVVSLPASAWQDATDGQHYELMSGASAIAGYVKGGSLTCVIGDPALTPAEVTALRDSLMRG